MVDHQSEFQTFGDISVISGKKRAEAGTREN